MHRKLLSLLFREPNPMDNAGTSATTSASSGPTNLSPDQMEAQQDLHATYLHPIKSSHQTVPIPLVRRKDLLSTLKQRELGLINFHRYADARHHVMDRMLPNHGEVVACMPRPTFCGQFSVDGQRFFSACQDYRIRLYDTTSSKAFDLLGGVAAKEVGWSILDTALAPDRTSVAYSTWSENLYLVKFNEDFEQSKIVPLRLEPDAHSFCIFSLQFSDDGTKIIGGSNDNSVYVYDLNKHQRTLRVDAHNDDVNAVRFIDDSNALIVSGSDDSLVSVWDQRALNESNPKPVGVFAGHTHGITFIHSRMDTRYLISNSKDQSIKLWDMRRFSKESTVKKALEINRRIGYGWDYRYQSYDRTSRKDENHIAGDPSVQTYRGHYVSYTLIRCYFSPAFSTGQKYIISGSADGFIRIYDVLTGAIKLTLRVSRYLHESREKCVRDVAWHPHENYIISTSWDSRQAHVRWTHGAIDQTEEPKSTSVIDVSPDQSSSSPRLNHPSSLRRLLIEQSISDQSDLDDDDDDDEDYNPMDE